MRRWLVVVAGLVAIGLAGGSSGNRRVDARTNRAPRTIEFAGRTWNIKAGKAPGPGPNDWSDSKEAVRVDAEGHLRLAILPSGDSWTCAEVVAPKSLGYGEYRWTFEGKLPTLDPRSVPGLFTYEDHTHEIDFELSRRGKADDDNGRFVARPDAPDSIRRFDAEKADRLTASFDWRPGAIHYRCSIGEDTKARPLREWTYAGPKVPRPGQERTIINFWLMDGRPSSGATRQDVTLRSFDFRPATKSRSRAQCDITFSYRTPQRRSGRIDFLPANPTLSYNPSTYQKHW